MTTVVPKARVVDALEAELGALLALAGELSGPEWSADTACPGWDVRANLAHVIGTESMLAGVPAPEVEVDPAATHVRNDIGRFNELWVRALAEEQPEEVLRRLRSVTEERLLALRAMGEAEWNAEGFTPAGTDTYGRFMRIRVFDCWMHEQDIRAAVGRPGHDAGTVVELVLDELATAVPYLVGKKAGTPSGSRVVIDLTGTTSRRWNVVVGARAELVDDLDGAPTTTIELPVLDFTRLAGGRAVAADVTCTVTGDETVGRSILDNLAYTI